jgi:hypothetical protein
VVRYVHQLFSNLEKSRYSERQRWALEELTGYLEVLRADYVVGDTGEDGPARDV